MTTITYRFAADHPAAAGHFPGRPIVPGALLLAVTLAEIAAVLGAEASACVVKSAKFHHPVTPGEEVLIDYSAMPSHGPPHGPPHGVRFSVTAGGNIVLAGQVQWRNPPP